MPQSAIQPGFQDGARDMQAVFRTAMDAMARPGRILPLQPRLTPPPPLSPCAAAVLLTLADFDTPLWLGAALAATRGVADYLRFHTGAKLVDDPAAAVFAIIADVEQLPPLPAFAQGTPEYPDRSTTLIIQVEALSDRGWVFAGPGIDGRIGFGAQPLPHDFAAQFAANSQAFPLGVDMIFAADNAIAALPRSARIVEGVSCMSR